MTAMDNSMTSDTNGFFPLAKINLLALSSVVSLSVQRQKSCIVCLLYSIRGKCCLYVKDEVVALINALSWL